MILLAEFTEVPETTLIEGVVVSIVGYVIVFIALLLLYYFFENLSKLINLQVKWKLRQQGKINANKISDFSVSGEVTAAISMAIYLVNELHDEESNVLTIKKVSRTYSPWSSKIYGLRNLNR